MKSSRIFKFLLLSVTIVICIIIGAVALIYVNRAAIAEKMLDYAVQGITGIDKSGDESEKTWLANLFTDNSSLKDAMLKAVTQRGMNYATQANGKKAKNNNRQPGLATLAEMFANGAGNEAIDVNTIAKVLVNSLGNNSQTGTDYQHNINSRDEKGRTILMNVCRGEVEPRIIRILLKYGADINAVDNKGRNALMYAIALNENPEIVQLLLDNGADARARDKNGKTVEEYANTSSVKAVLNRHYYRN